MPLSSNIDVGANIDKFRQLNELFEKYSNAVKQNPRIWVDYKNLIEATRKSAAGLNVFLEEHSTAIHETGRVQQSFGSAAEKAGKTFQHIARDAKNSAEYLVKSATSLFQISMITGTVFGLLGSGFGIYVLDRGAHQILERRRSALGLGTGYGSLQSFETNFARFGIGAQTLQATATGLYDVTSPEYLPLYATGARGGNTASTTVDLLRKLPALFAGVSDQMIGPTAERWQLTNLLSVREIVAYLHASPEERQAQIRHFEEDTSKMDLPPEVQEKWANFDVAMTRAGSTIESIIGNTLVGLADPLIKLSESSTKFIDALIDSETVSKGINSLALGLDWLAHKFESDEFKQDMKNFIHGIEGMKPYLITIGNVLRFATKLGIDAYRLWNDPNYNPSMQDFIFGKTPDTGIGSGNKYDATGRQPSIRFHTWKGPGTLPRGSGGPVIDESTGHMFVPNIFGTTPAGKVAGITASQLAPIEGETPEQLAMRINRLYPQLTNQECVELARVVGGIHGTVRDWRRGVGVSEANLPTGTPIATFMGRTGQQSNLYDAGVGVGAPGNNTTHAAVLMGYTNDGILVAEQYVGSNGVHVKEYKWGDSRGGEKAAENYRAINDLSGLPAGETNPFRNQVLAHIASDRFAKDAMGLNDSIQAIKKKEQAAAKDKTSLLNTLKGVKIPRAIVINNETGGSATVSAQRIQIAT